MKMMVMPRALNLRRLSKRTRVSLTVREEVGSSRISTSVFRLIALAISTICRWAMGRLFTRARVLMRTPKESSSAPALRCICVQSMAPPRRSSRPR